ncbi:MAG: hypothetical protein AVDCRST_MAG74-2206, partial [uncultured Pyrinomonadaceae bacterium]
CLFGNLTEFLRRVYLFLIFRKLFFFFCETISAEQSKQWLKPPKLKRNIGFYI